MAQPGKPFSTRRLRVHTRRIIFALVSALILAVFVVPMSAPESTLDKANSQASSLAEPGERKAIIDIGASYLGTPYYSMNCSQFTSAVYAEATGVVMPADYVAQRSYGYSTAVWKRGDLLTFYDGVGIYWGNGQVLMSSHYWGEVTIIDLQYLPPVLDVRRIR